MPDHFDFAWRDLLASMDPGSGADTPAKVLGAAMHTYNDHAKKNRKDTEENMTMEHQEYTARKIRRALRFKTISEEALATHQRELLRRLQAGELRMPKTKLPRDDIVAKLALLQGYTFSRTDAAYPRDRPKPVRPHRQRERKRKASANRD